ncbi:hypothetical protein [Micromonospora sp. WMMD710]|uniref:hypothetical protein n=1 Tax=Micromonospora sp. WMMD710 TaxID=3016085 RepID=UPI0024169984|nr:hypothetical protein [Micromonospora sp. WMMD710]MDG4757620.1 hypothetical protein [Micromonospora sp. WMMD710]
MKYLPSGSDATNARPWSAKSFADHCGGNFPRDFSNGRHRLSATVSAVLGVRVAVVRETVN